MLSEIRKLFDFTQGELAERIGITQNYYAVIESNPGKSAPAMKKLSAELKITEEFLALGDRSKYPFLSDFYFFYLDEHRTFSGYDFLNTKICTESSFVDIVFFIKMRSLPTLKFSAPMRIVSFAMRDDRDTVFLVTCKAKRRHFHIAGRNNPKSKKIDNEEVKFIYLVPFVDLLRKDLYKNDKWLVSERTVLMPDELYNKLEKGVIKRKDIIDFFPDNNHFKRLYEAHTK